jgi:serine/threonine protein kinase
VPPPLLPEDRPDDRRPISHRDRVHAPEELPPSRYQTRKLFVGGGHKSNQLFLIDFGLAKKFQDFETHHHIEFSSGKSLTGTARYASINAMRGYEQSRRDDLEAISYCMLYFLRGTLPWMGLAARNMKEKQDRIREVKERIPIDQLWNGYPPEFARFSQALRGLQFADAPNYALYRLWFRELFVKMGFVYDYQYDWVGKTPTVPEDREPLAPASSTDLLGRAFMTGSLGIPPPGFDSSAAAIPRH